MWPQNLRMHAVDASHVLVGVALRQVETLLFLLLLLLPAEPRLEESRPRNNSEQQAHHHPAATTAKCGVSCERARVKNVHETRKTFHPRKVT